MSILKVDTINEKTSGNGVQIAGHVVQVVRRDPTAAAITRFSGTSASYANTGLAISITPKFSNSLISVRASLNTGVPSQTYLYITLKRVISGGATTDLGFTGGGVNYGVLQHGVTGGAQLWHQASFEYPDAPNTTSQVTYQLWMRNSAGSGTHYLGWTGGADTTHNGMFLTATEIAQ
tara:strand:- start:687 stop:1217 length:531 start_codon:yes stop_codon:yes gene_type:complete